MAENRLRLELSRLFQWIAVAGVWCGVLVARKADPALEYPAYLFLMMMTVAASIALGQFIARAFRSPYRVEWTILSVGVGMLVPPLLRGLI